MDVKSLSPFCTTKVIDVAPVSAAVPAARLALLVSLTAPLTEPAPVVFVIIVLYSVAVALLLIVTVLLLIFAALSALLSTAAVSVTAV